MEAFTIFVPLFWPNLGASNVYNNNKNLEQKKWLKTFSIRLMSHQKYRMESVIISFFLFFFGWEELEPNEQR